MPAFYLKGLLMLLSPLFKGFVKESGPAGKKTGKFLTFYMYIDIFYVMQIKSGKTQMVSIQYTGAEHKNSSSIAHIFPVPLQQLINNRMMLYVFDLG